MFGLLPKESVFFSLFEKSAQNVHQAAIALVDLMEHYDDVDTKVRRIKNLEHAGDEFTHSILDHVAKTFITPLDREDIQRLATRLDDIVDQMDTAANRMHLFKIKQPTDTARALAQVLVKASSLIIDALAGLPNMKKPQVVMNCCVEIHTQENEGDRLMQHGMAKLFEEEPDAREIIKWKDIYQILEKGTDRCEDVADVLQTIVVKNA